MKVIIELEFDINKANWISEAGRLTELIIEMRNWCVENLNEDEWYMTEVRP